MNLLPISSIIVPPDRLRPVEAADVASLADSIEKLGLLQPLVVEGLTLRAGEHRLAALKLIYSQGETIRFGTASLVDLVPTIDVGDLSPLQRLEVELEENIKRKEMDWKERASAFARLHSIKAETALSHKEAVRETLAAIKQVDPADIKSKLMETHQTILVGNSLSDPDVAKAGSQKEALKIITRKLRREEDANSAPPPSTSFWLGDCINLLPGLEAATFDCLVTDPPYGVGISQLSYQVSSDQDYDDSYETWQTLLPFVAGEASRLLKPNADGYVFCDISRFYELKGIFEAVGFEVYPKPFIWNRSPDGRLTTADKWPRRVYETILYFRRGNRPLYEVRGDVLSYPADRNPGNYHGAKKPVALIRDLLERSTRKGDLILDPFVGSGATLIAAKTLSRAFVGIEKDPSYYGLATALLKETPSP